MSEPAEAAPDSTRCVRGTGCHVRMLAPALGLAAALPVLLTLSPGPGAADTIPPPPAPTHKPPPATVFPVMRIPGTSATLALHGRFHLARSGQTLTVRAAEPVVARIAGLTEDPLDVRLGATQPSMGDGAGDPLLTVDMRDGEPPRARLSVAEAMVETAGLALVIENVEAEADLGGSPTLRIRSLRVRPQGIPAWTQPLVITATATDRGDGWALDGTATGLDGRVSLGFSGVVATEDAGDHVDLRLQPVTFAPGGLQPRDLTPLIGDTITAARGSLGAAATVRFGEGEPQASGRIDLNDLSFLSGGVTVSGLDGTIRLSRVWPPRTPPGQVLRAARIDPGVAATDALVRFQIDGRGRLRIDDAGVSVSGGRLSVEDAVIDPAAREHRLVLRASGLDLQDVLNAAAVDEATASGRVSGSIPVTLSESGITVSDATLATDQPGVLRYHPVQPPPALQQDDQRIELLRSALEDFHYDRLSVDLSGRSGGEWRSTVQIAGNNPGLLDGQPIVLNVNLTVVPGEARVDLAGRTLDVGDALPLYNALFGVGFLEWLGDRLAALRAPALNPGDPSP